MPKTVCVTGANGFLASHIVSQLLARGFTVHATVRDCSIPIKVDHLKQLEGASERLHLFSTGNLTEPKGAFDKPLEQCDSIIHAATPVLFSSKDGENDIFKPAMASTTEILAAVARAGTIKTFVLVSSMSSVAPDPEPALKSEVHWSDPEKQKAKGSWYGAAKTSQEAMVHDFVKAQSAKNGGKSPFRFVAMCPTAIFGPRLQPSMNSTMGWLLSLYKGDKDKASNDSMSFIDVRDCAAQHVEALTNENAEGRYMSLVESLHWNEVYPMLKEIYPAMKAVAPCDGVPIKPTQFDLTRMNSLGVNVRDVKTILKDAFEDFKVKGEL